LQQLFGPKASDAAGLARPVPCESIQLCWNVHVIRPYCAAEGATEQTAEVLRRLLGKLQIWSRVTRKTQHVRQAMP
jgi:hypothetical protein